MDKQNYWNKQAVNKLTKNATVLHMYIPWPALELVPFFFFFDPPP